MPPAETGVTTLARAVLDITEKPFPIEMRGPGAAMLEALAAHKGGWTTMAVANKWLLGYPVENPLSACTSSAAACHTPRAPQKRVCSRKRIVRQSPAPALTNT